MSILVEPPISLTNPESYDRFLHQARDMPQTLELKAAVRYAKKLREMAVETRDHLDSVTKDMHDEIRRLTEKP